MSVLKAVLALVAVAAFLLVGAAAGIFIRDRMGTPAGQPTGAPTAGAAASPGASASSQTAAAPQKQLYYCPMHPSYVSDKPGDCPICNMALVPLKTAPPQMNMQSSAPSVEGHATVAISAEGQQLIGVQTGVVTKQAVKKAIRAVGMITYNERGLSTVTLKFSGWVDRLLVKATGDTVKKGDPLLIIYSPEFLEAQRNYLLAVQSSDALGADAGVDAQAFAEQGVASARERLLLWDISPRQIDAIRNAKDPRKNVTILSKAAGVVIARNVTEGAYVEPGTQLYQLADLSTVWLEADLYEYEMPLVKIGDEASITLASYPGDEIAAKVSYVYPYLNKETRTVRARFEIPNPDGRFKPGMYGTVNLETDLGENLVADENAVLDTGTRQIVFVVRDAGVFEPREIVTGQHTDAGVIVLKGLSEGDRIVTSGNFMVNSESRLKGASAGAGMPGMPGMAMPASSSVETPAGQGGGMENMPGMSGPAGTSGAAQAMPGMEMPASSAVEKPAAPGGGMENMPGMSAAPMRMESTADMQGMPGMEMPASSAVEKPASSAVEKPAPSAVEKPAGQGGGMESTAAQSAESRGSGEQVNR